MSNRPGQIAYISKGKSIGAQNNMADTLNWIISCIDSMTGEGDVQVQGKDQGQLVISVQPKDSESSRDQEGSGRTYEFASAADSNVHITTSDDGNGVTKVTIGVYYT